MHFHVHNCTPVTIDKLPELVHSMSCCHTPYRYFLHNWPQLAFLAYDGDHCFGTVVCKMDVHREQMLRGYLAMLVVEKPYRSLGTGAMCAVAAVLLLFIILVFCQPDLAACAPSC